MNEIEKNSKDPGQRHNARLEGVHTVIRGTKTIKEFQEKRAFMEKRASELYEGHKKAVEHWNEGEIAKIWIDGNNNFCVEYESGQWWRYDENGDPQWL